MDIHRDIATVARLLGDPARAVMLSRLLDGRAAAAGELAREAGIAPQTASEHLAKLLAAGLVRVTTSGRHRYYSLSGSDVALALETLGVLPSAVRRSSRVPAELRFARTCYDHLAGWLGVAIAETCVSRTLVSDESGVMILTEAGRRYFIDLGIATDTEPAEYPRGRTCMDWSERRPHIGGALGSALLERLLASGWISRTKVPRALRVTLDGRRELERRLGLRFDHERLD